MTAFRGLHVNGREREPRPMQQGGARRAQERVSAQSLRSMTPGSNRAHEALVDVCLEYLGLNGIPAVPIHTGPRVTPNGDGTFGLRLNRRQRGFGDIVGVLPPFGRLLLIDVKTGGARLKLEQVELHQRFEEAGAVCLVVREIGDLEAHVRAVTRRRQIQGGSRERGA